ncbi:hypothetical protein P5673_014447, partial [Acropora cervicornis]
MFHHMSHSTSVVWSFGQFTRTLFVFRHRLRHQICKDAPASSPQTPFGSFWATLSM